jgi:hypothetical protein
MENNDIYQNVESSEPVESTSEEVSYENVENEVTESDTTPQEEYDIIRYNKEEVKIPVSERQTYLQKGYNYDKVYSQLEQTKQQSTYLERIAKMQGFETTDDFLKAVDEMEEQRRYEQDAERLGVDTQVIREHLEPMRRELDALKAEREALQKVDIERQVDAEVQRLKSEYPDFEQVQERVFDLAIEKGYSLEDAYILATYKDKAKQVEQETLAKVANRDQKQVLSSIDKPGNMLFDVNNLTSEQLQDISTRVQRGERITF